MSKSTSSSKSTIDAQEVENFSRIAEEWWDINGPFKPLHLLNPTRISYLKSQILSHFNRPDSLSEPLKKLSILDVGCGGGLVCEPLTRLGATVTGLDASERNISIAKEHADKSGLSIAYLADSVENLARQKEKYDVVLALEIIEHVADIPLFIESCLGCLKKDGIIIFSTLNRTHKSYLLGIVAAEYILRWVPKGTHQWKKFIKPSELVKFLEHNSMKARDITGLIYNPISKEFSLHPRDLDVNYFLSATKA